MVAALVANVCLIVRFLEKRVKEMTIVALCLLSVHGLFTSLHAQDQRHIVISYITDLVNAVTVIVFGVEHRFSDGFTYGQPFWLVVASSV